jgi:hypothetical protein
MIFNFLKRKVSVAQDIVTNQTVGTFEVVEKVITTSEKVVSSVSDPLRKRALKRFPVLFSILAAVGATATFLGLEQVILQYDIFLKYPFLLLTLGIILLVFTGRLYKKLE